MVILEVGKKTWTMLDFYSGCGYCFYFTQDQQYSKFNKLKINNWIEELRISKEKTIQRKQHPIKEPTIKRSLINARTATDNKEVNKEPASRLIDKRFANVKDWKKLEKDSSKERSNRNNCNLVKNM